MFISYRRADSRGDTGRIYDPLAAEFGAAHVFRDDELDRDVDEPSEERSDFTDMLSDLFGSQSED
jgi:hypothetical protein